MGETTIPEQLEAGLARALARAGIGPPERLERLTGGATMESWRFSAGGGDLVLRRAPSPEMMESRAFGHEVEAALIRAVRAARVAAPEIVVDLAPEDAIGTGFVMRALAGTPDPRTILECDAPGALLAECARELARIGRIDGKALPPGVPTMIYGEALGGLGEQFEQAGGDRPIIALALRWLADHVPEPIEPRLVHGDFRMGNLLVEGGALTGVLDWELAHLGDPHEDLAYACMTVWRFHRIDRPALGLGSVEAWIAAYEEAAGRPVDRARFGFWLVYRTCWWALGCLRMGETWRGGANRTLERAVISRRTSEQELDLLMLLEEEAPATERERALPPKRATPGEAAAGELAVAVSEWLATLKERMEGHDRFQLAVARNALGIVARADAARIDAADRGLAQALLAGDTTLASPGVLAALRRAALDKLAVDMPRYPALGQARRLWGDA